jgi:hypothetical protein
MSVRSVWIVLGVLAVFGMLNRPESVRSAAAFPDKAVHLFVSENVIVDDLAVEPKRIIRDPLRFGSKFSVYFRFFAPLSLYLVGFFFGIWSGEYFYRERNLIGATLFGCGGMCGLCAWWIGATGATL